MEFEVTAQKDGEKKKEEKKAEPEASKTEIKLREIIIKTDGANWQIVKLECTPLELKAIMRDILRKLGE